MIVLILFALISMFVGYAYRGLADVTVVWFWITTVCVFLQILMVMSEWVPTVGPTTVRSSRNQGISWILVLVSPIIIHWIALLFGRVGLEFLGRITDDLRFFVLIPTTLWMIALGFVARYREDALPNKSQKGFSAK